jgi:hypothetical protein
MKQSRHRYSEEQIFQELRDARDQLFQGFKDKDQEKRDSDDYSRLVGRAIRRGYMHLPEVKEFIAGQRSVNNYDWLRKFKIGLERDLNGEIDAADFWINMIAAELKNSGLSFGEIHRRLNRLVNAPDFPGPLFNNDGKCWLVEGDHARAELQKAIRRRIRTEQNLHKRILNHEPEPTPTPNRSPNRHDRQVEEIVRRRRARSNTTLSD